MADARGGAQGTRICPKCGKARPLGDFRSRFYDMETKWCASCTMRARVRKAKGISVDKVCDMCGGDLDGSTCRVSVYAYEGKNSRLSLGRSLHVCRKCADITCDRFDRMIDRRYERADARRRDGR